MKKKETVKKEMKAQKPSSRNNGELKDKRRGAPRRKTEKYTPNTKWLLSLLESKGITQQDISRKAQIPKGTLSKIFHGKRRPTLREIGLFATILSTPLDDLLSAFGVPLSAPASANAFLEITGWIDAQLILRGLSEESHGVYGLRGSKTAPCPFPDRDIRVARLQTAGSEFDGLDGALVYYRETSAQARGVDQDAIGRMGLVKVTGSPERRLRVLRRAYSAAKFNLTSLAGRLMEEAVSVESFYPVVWLKL